MVETVTARASHYDVLGVEPTASSDEIARAFAREMGRPRAFGGLADVSIAYEVLRNADRRQAYDESIGVKKQSEPEPEAEVFRRPHALHARAQFIAAAPLVASPVKDAPVAEEPKVELAPVETRNEPSLPPFFADALRDIAAPAPLPKRRLEPSAPMPRQVIEPMFSDDSPAPWKKIAIPAGVAVLAVALLGAWTGWQSKSDPTEAASVQASLIKPPPMTTYAVNDPVEKAADTSVLGDSSDVVPPPPVATPAERKAVRHVRTKPSTGLADVEQQLGTSAEAAAGPSPAPGDAPVATTVAASMPLPNSVIARTIGKIGYPCGSVASTSASGSPGVFTVTCSSGHSYKAAPVRGRYHFSRVRG